MVVSDRTSIPLMHTWNWKTWDGLPYLTCSLLEPWFHGFFTQKFWSRSPSKLVEILQPNAEVYRVKQVHGNVVLSASEAGPLPNLDAAAEDGEITLPEADGLLTEDAKQAVWVCSADCTPVLIADAETGQVAAVHAGWRGTATKVVPQAIARLQAQGSRLQDLRVAMGPAIAGTVYQVSTKVAAEVGATVVHQHSDVGGTQVDGSGHETEILEALYQLPDAPVYPDPEPGRVRLDVRRVNTLQLEQLGFQADQVAIAPYCTYQNPDHFFSYRRDRLKKVQWSGIISRDFNKPS